MTVMVGGAPTYPTKNIVENAVNSKDHTTLVAAVKAAGLVDTLESPRSVHRLRADQRSVRRAAQRHGRDAAQAGEQGQADRDPHLSRRPRPQDYGRIAGKIDEMGGKLTLKTVQGEDLTIERMGKSALTVTDANGDVARITIPDVLQSNGVIHVINKVLIPG